MDPALGSSGKHQCTRWARGEDPSRISEGFITASIVFCVGPLTILGSIENGLTGDIQLLAVKSLLDGVASIAFAAELGVGVYLSVIAIFVIQGGIALAAWLLEGGLDQTSIKVASAVGGLIMLGVGLRMLDIKQVRVVSTLGRRAPAAWTASHRRGTRPLPGVRRNGITRMLAPVSALICFSQATSPHQWAMTKPPSLSRTALNSS